MNVQSIRCWLFGAALIGMVFVASPRTEGATYTWTPTAAGTYNWNNAPSQDNWGTGSGGVFPNAVGDFADMGLANITGTVTVLLPQAVTIGTWNIGDASGAQLYSIGTTSGNAITLNNGGSGAVINRVDSAATSVLTINAPIILADDLTYNSLGSGTRRADYFGNISEIGGSRSVTKTGPGTLNMRNTAANTYTGNTTITGGFWDQYVTNGVPSGLGIGDLNVTAGSFLFRASNTRLNGLNVSAGAFVATGAAGNLNLIFGNNDADSVISGSVNNGAGNVSPIKVGSGNATFNSSATNTIRNFFMINGAGTVTLDFANMATPTNQIANAVGGLFMSGGTLAIQAKSSGTTNQTFNALTNNQTAGASYFTLDQNGGDGVNFTITSATVTRGEGNTLDFSKTGTGNFNWNPGLTNGIVGGWVTANKNTWATVTGGQIVDYTGYTTTATAGDASGNYNSALNIDVDSNQTIDAGVTMNSLRFNDNTANRTLTLTGPSTINSGGILVTNGVGAFNEVITGSTLNSAATTDLIVHQHNTSGTLEIASQIVDNGGGWAVTKSGAGLLKISNPSNSYTGITYINQGTLQLGNSEVIPNASGVFMVAKATFDLNGFNETIASLDGLETSLVTNDGGGAKTLTFGSTLISWLGIIQDGSGTINVTKTGAGAAIFSNANTYSGNTTINGGTLSLTMNGAVGGSMNNSLLITVNSGATLNTVSHNSFTIGPPSEATQRVLTIDSGGSANMWNLVVGAAGGDGLVNQNGTLNGVPVFWGKLTVGSGAGSVGTFNHATTSFTRFGSIIVGDAATANGTVLVSNGTFNASETGTTTATFIVGNSGTGTINQSGGIVRSSGATSLFLGMNAGSSGTYIQDHGSFIGANSFVIGESGTGLFSQNIDGTATITANTIVGDSATGVGTHNIAGTSALSSLNYIVGNAVGSQGVVNMTGGTINLSAGGSPHLFVGNEGTGVFNHSAGTVNATTPNGYVSIGEAATGDGTYNLSGTGVLNAGLYLLVGDLGHGVMNQTGGSASAGDIAIGESGLVGQYEMYDGSLSASGGLFVGDVGIGTFNLYSGGSQTVDTALVSIGQVSGAVGLVTMDGGTINTTQLFVGNFGSGSIEHTAGTMNVTAGDAFVTIGEAATGGGTYNLSGTGNFAAGLVLVGDLGHGLMNQTGGAVDAALIAIAESGSGGEYEMSGGSLNISVSYYIGDNGPGTWNVSGASTTTNLTAATADTNSVRAAILAADPSIAVDGNIIVGTAASITGLVNQSDGTNNISANIAVGYMGSGTWNQTGGVNNVGLHGGTGGDVVLGLSPGSSGDYILAGGTLNVTTGSGSIALGLGSGSFNFSGGTLKVVDFNDTATFGGDLGGLVQNGPATLLDATGNDTLIHGTYNLVDGTVNTGSIYTTTVTGVLAADGAGATTALVTGSGTLNANSGLAIVAGGQLDKAGSGTLRVSGAQSNGAGSTLNATNGAVILNSNAGSIGALNMNLLADGSMTTATLNATQHLASLSATSGALVTLTAPPAAYTTPGYTPGTTHVTTDSLAIDFAGGATVDLGNGAMIVNYSGPSPLASITAMAANASNLANFSSWDLPGLTSSVAAADYFSTGSLGVGVVDNNDLLNITLGYAYDGITGAQFNATATGEAVSADSILVKLTYYGDSDLNGATDITDYFLFLAGLTDPTNNPANWMNGDYDYSGTTDITDYFYFLAGLSATNTYGDVLSGGGGPVDLAGGGPVAVPEPSSILLLVLGGLGLAWRARGKTRR